MIGRDLKGAMLGSGPVPPKRLQDSGKKWFEENQQRLRSSVCKNAAVRSLADKADSTALIEAVAALFLTVIGHVNPFPVAVIIVRMGIKGFCKEEWQIDT
jgi:hypothetical protein